MPVDARSRAQRWILRSVALGAVVAGLHLGWLSAGEIPELDAVVERAVADGLVAGAVVVAGTREAVRFERAYGRVWGGEGEVELSIGAVFDVASLTKVVATAPVVVSLAEEGRLSLSDPVERWLPEFAGRGKEALRVGHLLTHSSGLEDLAAVPADEPLAHAIRVASARPLRGEPGTCFRYLDVNYLLLGEIARRAGGEGLDRLAQHRVFSPLGLADTSFRPVPELRSRCVPTRGTGGARFQGEVQDPWGRALGGVAGNSGVFSTGRDLAGFCRAMLGEGALGGRRFLSPDGVRLMTAAQPLANGTVLRGLGWDIRSPYSAPRGDVFSDASFGHTGYSGCSVWIDPGADAFVVLLTARLDYRRVAAFNRLRADVSNAAGALFARGRSRPGEAASGG